MDLSNFPKYHDYKDYFPDITEFLSTCLCGVVILKILRIRQAISCSCV